MSYVLALAIRPVDTPFFEKTPAAVCPCFGVACFLAFVVFPRKKTTLLESLLAHLETAASNGSATEAPAAEKAAEEPKKDEAAPAEVSLVS